MKVLQIFHRYLDNSSNWAYRLIKDLPSTHITIAAPVFLNKEFILPKATYIKPLINFIPTDHENILKRFVRKINSIGLKRDITKHSPNFDFIHAHFAHTGCEYMDLASQLNKKLIVSFYGYDYENLPHLYTQYIPLYQKLFAQSKAIITEGKFGKETLIKLGCSPEKIYIIPLGVDLSNIPIKTKFKKKNELRLIQVSNFKEKKGHIYTLKALEIAVTIHPNISLTLAGDGPLHHEIQSLASKLQLSNHIHFIEQIPFSKLHDFLIDFDALIQPSIRTKDKDTEGGAPVIILDAQACGLPIISNFHADIPNITIQNKTAILTKEKDTEALAKSIIEFYEMDEENYLCFSSNAKNFIYENFESKLCSARLENLYHNL